MIKEYFNSPTENFIKFYENLAQSSFGKNIDIFGFSENDLSNLDKYDIAIFYLNDVKESESVIKRIYSLEYGNWNLKIFFSLNPQSEVDITLAHELLLKMICYMCHLVKEGEVK